MPDGNSTFGTAINLGSLNGSISRVGSVGFTFGSRRDLVDFYRFSLSSTRDVSSILSGMSQDGDLFLYNSRFQELGRSRNSGNRNDSITRRLGVGIYYLGIRAFGAARTSYSLNLRATAIPDPDGSFGRATNVGTLSSTTRTFADSVGFTQVYGRDLNDYRRFTVTGTRDVTATLSGMTQDGDLYIYNSRFQELARSRNSGNRNDTIIRRLGAGTYYVRVNAFGSARTGYRLGLRASSPPDPDGTFSRATNVGTLSSTTRTFADNIGFTQVYGRDFSDYRRFTLTGTRDFTATLSSMTQDGDLFLYNSRFQELGRSRNSGNRNDTITRRLGAGTYYIRVSAFGSARTGYRLGLRAANAVSATIAPNQIRSGVLSSTDPLNPLRSGAYYDDYRLTGARAGQRIQLNLESSRFDTYLQLVDARTGRAISFNDDGGSGLNSQLTFVAQAGRIYNVRATSFGARRTGLYTLRATTSSPTVNIGLNQSRAGFLSATDGRNPLRSGTYSEDYRLIGARVGQRVQVDLSSGQFDPFLQLVNASTGNLISSNDDGGPGLNSRLSFVAEQGVSYLLRVTSFRVATGSYTIRTSIPRSPIVRSSLSLNQTRTGALTTFDGLNPLRAGRFADDYNLFGVRAGQRVRLNLNSTAFDPFLQLLDGRTGRLLASNDDAARGNLNSELTFVAQAGRSYRLRVTSFSTSSVGNYTVSSNLIGRPISLSSIGLNQTRVGALAATDGVNPLRADTYADDYNLAGVRAGQQIQINLNARGSNLDTYLQLVDARTGRLLSFNDDGGVGRNSQLTFTAVAGTSYRLRVTSFFRNAVGGYSLSTRLLSTQPPTGGGFSRTYGYGLVNAAAAVARAINRPTFANVPNLGGNEWGNDLVNAPEAWARGYRGQGITVAVIDSGVDIDHPDLRNNIWRNTDEIPNNGIDDDRNGFVDDIHGWNFGVGQNNNDVTPGTRSLGQGHGTHVAGTIAGARNGLGNTGVAYSSRIMAIRLGDVDNRGRFTNGGDLARAIRYAVDNGARVVNMSIGWSDSPALRSAVAYAASRNVILVSAAGNSALSSPGIPARFATQSGISVGAVDRNRRIASFSNRAGLDSSMLHVVGPGVNVISSVPVAEPGGNFNTKSGTSMASPHVAGVVALMLSANPRLTHAQVRQILLQTSTRL